MERRRSVRIATDLILRATDPHGQEAYAVAADLSEDGLFVEVVLPHRPGEVLELQFDLPGHGSVRARAKVVSAQRFLPSDLSGKVGNGLRFVDLDAEQRGRIRAFLEAKLA